MEARRLGPSADDSAAWLFAVERDANGGELRLVDAGAPSSISGIEQEYAVWLDDVQVPFAPLLGAVLPNAPTRGFGEDPLARVRRDGAVWTADGPHAETATPPRRLAPGIATRLADDTLHQREMLLRRLRRIAETDGTRLELRGYSTHVNAFCASVDAWACPTLRRVVRAGHHAPRRQARFAGSSDTPQAGATRDRDRVSGVARRSRGGGSRDPGGGGRLLARSRRAGPV